MATKPPTGQKSRLEIFGRTDPGLLRPVNEDTFVVLKEPDLPKWCVAAAAVFDGVGGLGNGWRASTQASAYFVNILKEQSRSSAKPKAPEPESELSDILCEIHSRLREELRHDANINKMATTAIIALVPKSAPSSLWVGHVGDSPVILLRRNTAKMLAAEDSLVWELMKDGLITPKEARHHPRRHVITQALGYGEFLTPHADVHESLPGDWFLLCTDGLTAMLTEPEILKIVQKKSPKQACTDLIDAANAAGGSDNITVVAMKF